jgi:hypothetical protein
MQIQIQNIEYRMFNVQYRREEMKNEKGKMQIQNIEY